MEHSNRKRAVLQWCIQSAHERYYNDAFRLRINVATMAHLNCAKTALQWSMSTKKMLQWCIGIIDIQCQRWMSMAPTFGELLNKYTLYVSPTSNFQLHVKRRIVRQQLGTVVVGVIGTASMIGAMLYSGVLYKQDILKASYKELVALQNQERTIASWLRVRWTRKWHIWRCWWRWRYLRYWAPCSRVWDTIPKRDEVHFVDFSSQHLHGHERLLSDWWVSDSRIRHGRTSLERRIPAGSWLLCGWDVWRLWCQAMQHLQHRQHLRNSRGSDDKCTGSARSGSVIWNRSQSTRTQSIVRARSRQNLRLAVEYYINRKFGGATAPMPISLLRLKMSCLHHDEAQAQ